MSAVLVGLIIGVGGAAVFLSATSSRVGRIVGALALSAITMFCAFGFLHSFESPGIDAWKISYALTGSLSGLGTLWLLLSKTAVSD